MRLRLFATDQTPGQPGVVQIVNSVIFGSAVNCDGGLFQSLGHNISQGSCVALSDPTDRDNFGGDLRLGNPALERQPGDQYRRSRLLPGAGSTRRQPGWRVRYRRRRVRRYGAQNALAAGRALTHGQWEGALAGNTVVLFPQSASPTQPDVVRYTAPAGAAVHVITGLTPGAGYDVQMERTDRGTVVSIQPGAALRSDEGGVLVIR